MYICVSVCVSTLGGWKRALNPLELESQVVVRCPHIWELSLEEQALLATESSAAFSPVFHLTFLSSIYVSSCMVCKQKKRGYTFSILLRKSHRVCVRLKVPLLCRARTQVSSPPPMYASSSTDCFSSQCTKGPFFFLFNFFIHM